MKLSRRSWFLVIPTVGVLLLLYGFLLNLGSTANPRTGRDPALLAGDEARIDAELRREFTALAHADSIHGWGDLWSLLPDSLGADRYQSLSVLLDSLEIEAGLAPTSSYAWVRWAQVRAGVCVRARQYSDGAKYFRRAREAVPSHEETDLWLNLANREIGCLEKASDYESLLETLDIAIPLMPGGPQRLFDGWAARIRFTLGKLEWESEITGVFGEIDRESSGLSVVVRDFIVSPGDTLMLTIWPSSLFISDDDIWTPGGLGYVFSVDEPPTYEGSRRQYADVLGRRAQVKLIGSTLVLAELMD